MDPRHRGLYVRWCQSPRVELLVGQDVGQSERFVIPQEFLQRRSRTLREQIAKLEEYISSKEIALPETTPQTMEEFFIWNFTPNPQVDERLSFRDVVQLGIFAWNYQVSALSNQVTDMIRHNLANNEWKLEAAIVDAIYQAAPAKSPLREVIRAALGQLPRSCIDGEEWERTWKRNPDLGWDHHKSGDKEWTPKDYLTGSCRFHNHDEIKRRLSLCDGCPYAQEDCYPVWEDDPEEQESEVEEVTEGWPAAEDHVMGEMIPNDIQLLDVPKPMEQAVEEGSGPAASVFEDAPEGVPEETGVVETAVETNGVTDHGVPAEVIEDGDGIATPHPETNGVKNIRLDEVLFESDACSASHGSVQGDEGPLAVNGAVTNGLEESVNGAMHVEAVNGHDISTTGDKKKKGKKSKKKRMGSISNGNVNVSVNGNEPQLTPN
ncbi:uncharacterized protein A1O5_08409 [Cladophialophora psammophila CBS 110553]|uniref:Uncharacterized protein n=1 Tax=Cladophialophora psammophila CBS 110553 TaxID=1182543 RepID=W9WU95_9EURO|nr:uncharacterized protein A1O5_08409 [Cladophialophora psammophila CBS 110553]EXJ68615.1 hypothetical protein A1O5_08409 [Cladophialophora psammophila CBS 110553]